MSLWTLNITHFCKENNTLSETDIFNLLFLCIVTFVFGFFLWVHILWLVVCTFLGFFLCLFDTIEETLKIFRFEYILNKKKVKFLKALHCTF